MSSVVKLINQSDDSSACTVENIRRIDSETGAIFIVSDSLTGEIQIDVLGSAYANNSPEVGDSILVIKPVNSVTPVLVDYIGKSVKHLADETAMKQKQIFREVDGKEVLVLGDREIKLKCGRASIVLSRDGKIILRGTSISSRASGSNKVKGASVQIN